MSEELELAREQTWMRLLRRLTRLDRDHPIEDVLGTLIGTYLKTVAAEFGLILVTLKQILDVWDIDRTFGPYLVTKARDFGILPRRNETDEWLRQRVKLWIYVQQSSGTVAQIRRACAWFIGILKQNALWQEHYMPKLHIAENAIPYYLDGKRRPLQFIMTAPYELLQGYSEPAFRFSFGVGEWRENREHGFNAGLLNGRTVLSELLDCVEVVKPGGVRGQVWRKGFKFSFVVGEWRENRYSGFGAAPLSALADTFILRSRDEWDFLRHWAYPTEKTYRLGRQTPHPYLGVSLT